MSGRVLVTGGAGFIGSHLADAYVDRGWSVTVVDDFSTGLRGNIHPAVRLVEGDIRDSDVIERAFEDHVDLVSHHAARVDLRQSMIDPAMDAETNILASLRLIQAAVNHGVKKVIFASSGGAIYAEPSGGPPAENAETSPSSPYGCAKLAVEHYLHFFRRNHGIVATSLRYANVYGPRQRTRGEAGVVALFAGSLLRGEAVQIFGSGEQTRDFVYVDDVVRANMAVSERSLDGSFNVSTGMETSINQLYGLLVRLIGADTKPTHGPSPDGEQFRSVLDGARLRAAADLPVPVGLPDGLALTVDWIREENSSPLPGGERGQR